MQRSRNKDVVQKVNIEMHGDKSWARVRLEDDFIGMTRASNCGIGRLFNMQMAGFSQFCTPVRIVQFLVLKHST